MIVTIEDLRLRARRRLPRAVFDFVDGGAEDESTLKANRAAFERVTFRPRVLVDVSRREHASTVLGESLTAPIILAPTGLAGLVAPRGEILAARVAARRGLRFTLSTHSMASIEDVAVAVPGPKWFQLYVVRNREVTRSLIERSRAAGYTALCLTADVPVIGQRERDIRNGFTIPPRVTIANIVDTLQKIPWLIDAFRGPRVTFKNFVDAPGSGRNDAISLGAYAQSLHDPSVSWKDLAWFRSVWQGPMLLKGIMTAEDARLAVEHGVEGIVVSNHGGRQLDGLPSSLEVLPEIADAVAGRADIVFDGGIRRGGDIVKAIALGATACMLGRAILYGLAARGEEGVERALDILLAEMDRTMALLGRTSLAEIDRSAVNMARL
ncbi:MAG: alpha-hydroxy acid oxidase [Chloroflexota bacterium]